MATQRAAAIEQICSLMDDVATHKQRATNVREELKILRRAAAGAGQRHDAWYIKMLWETSSPAERASIVGDYLSLPYVDMIHDIDEGEGPDVLRAPWVNFVMQMAPSVVVEILTNPTSGDLLLLEAHGVEHAPGSWLCLVTCGDARSKFVTAIDPVRREDGLFGAYVPAKAPRPDDLGVVVSGILSSLRELSASPKHLVRISAPTTPRDIKSAKHKPWARTDLPRVILLDPEAARLHGHRQPKGGTHASPRIHQRRGHWATLRHDRYGDNRGKHVWRKPAWVGEREWDFRGAHYRVLNLEVAP